MTTERDRLAKVLERLVSDDPPELALVVAARLWADDCLVDANAALELLEEHWDGLILTERDATGWRARLGYEGSLVAEAWPCKTLPEALCAAFVAWAESEAER